MKKQECYLLVDYIHWKGGTYNVQRARIVPVGNAWGYIKMFTSEQDKAKSRAEAWARKNNIELV
jgi:hypothetical protein